MASGAKGVVANIPEVTSIPYFTTAKWNDAKLDAVQVEKWAPFVTTFNQTLDALQQDGSIADAALRKLHYQEGNHNPFLIVDADLKDVSTRLKPIEKELEKQGVAADKAEKWVKLFGQARPAHKRDFILIEGT